MTQELVLGGVASHIITNTRDDYDYVNPLRYRKHEVDIVSSFPTSTAADGTA